MNKRNKIIYWIATLWLSLGMLSTGIVQLVGIQEEADSFTKLGYPLYLMPVIGAWKILGVITILIPKFPIVKEWAYAGFFFAMSGAAISHIAVGDSAIELFGPLLLITLITLSWHFRPEGRKLVKATCKKPSELNEAQ